MFAHQRRGVNLLQDSSVLHLLELLTDLLFEGQWYAAQWLCDCPYVGIDIGPVIVAFDQTRAVYDAQFRVLRQQRVSTGTREECWRSRDRRARRCTPLVGLQEIEGQ